MIFQIIFPVFLLFSLAFGQVDKTLQPNEKGENVVKAVLSKIQNKCLFSNDKLFFRRLAYMETEDGNNPNTFASGYYGGIWKVNQDQFEKTKLLSPSILHKILINFNIDWKTVSWKNLTKPLYSGLAIHLIFFHYNAIYPISISEQASLWKRFYRPNGNIQDFVTKVTNYEKDCYGIVDLCLIFDSSGSIQSDNFDIMKKFAKDLISKLDVGPNEHFQSRVSMVYFSTNVSLAFNFLSYSTVNEYMSAIDKIPYVKGVTNTAHALNFVANKIFTSASGARSNLPKVALVVTDGASNNKQETIQAAQLMHNKNINTFVIGVGTGVVNTELEAIASDPDCRSIFLLKNFREFDFLVHSIQTKICDTSVIIYKPTNISNETKRIKIENTFCTTEFTISFGEATIYYSKNPSLSSVFYDGKFKISPGNPFYLKINFTSMNFFIESKDQIDMNVNVTKNCFLPCELGKCPNGSYCKPKSSFSFECDKSSLILTTTKSPDCNTGTPVNSFPWFQLYLRIPFFQPPSSNPKPPSLPFNPNSKPGPCPQGYPWIWYPWVFECNKN